MIERKQNYTLGELLDRLSITQLKEVKIPEHKAQYSQEISDILHDINYNLGAHRELITAEWIRDVIVLAQFNSHIWNNEADVRNGIKAMQEGKELSTEEWADIGRRLMFTHSANGIRNTAKNRVNKVIGARLEHKIDCLAADHEQWRPSGY